MANGTVKQPHEMGMPELMAKKTGLKSTITKRCNDINRQIQEFCKREHNELNATAILSQIEVLDTRLNSLEEIYVALEDKLKLSASNFLAAEKWEDVLPYVRQSPGIEKKLEKLKF